MFGAIVLVRGLKSDEARVTLILKNHITTLIDDLRGLLVDSGNDAAQRILTGWPAATTVERVPSPCDLPVTVWLPEVAAHAPSATVGIVRSLAEVGSELRWQQTYSKHDLGHHFLDRYAWVMLLGPDAPVTSNSLLVGFLLLGPDIEYPVHKHSAEEIYVVVSGTASWKIGDEDWQLKIPGSIIHNPPWQLHGMRTDQGEPLLLAFMWNSGTLEKSQLAAGVRSD